MAFAIAFPLFPIGVRLKKSESSRLGVGVLLDTAHHFSDELELASVAKALSAQCASGLSHPEQALLKSLPRPSSLFFRELVQSIREQILAGLDPLGDALCRLRTAEHRRVLGATYTPLSIVDEMLKSAESQIQPTRIIDPGTGSGRFLLAAAKRFPKAKLIGLEVDPLPALLGRANIVVSGLQDRAEILLGDYRSFTPAPVAGATLYIGNPPYVRHHLIEQNWKEWLVREAETLGARTSQLAGLHAYFFLATARTASVGDVGIFITAAEWLDVNYGSLIRDLFIGRLGGQRIVVIEPTAMPFPDAATTAAVTSFQVGTKPKSVRLKRVAKVGEINDRRGNRVLRRERLESESRWSHLTRVSRKVPEGFIELGEICRVHRGQVTGANRVWIAEKHSEVLPQSVLFPTVTRAMELIRAGNILADSSSLRQVIDIPVDLSVFDSSDRRSIDKFLRFARDAGAHLGYVALNRKAWWSVGLRLPAPILATYMARRPPVFVRNMVSARHINIAHGLYPREPMTDLNLRNLVRFLNSSTRVTEGRTYAGGLTKFEPREMERLLVPDFRIADRIDA